jgi:hypothetical protein
VAGLSPLTGDHLQALNKVLQAIPIGLELVKRCQACGLDVSEFQAQLEAQQRMAAALKAQFFPSES